MALARRAVGPGLVHHSDRGSQYASNDYTDLLKANGIEISMSRKGNPWDNLHQARHGGCTRTKRYLSDRTSILRHPCQAQMFQVADLLRPDPGGVAR